MGKAAPIESERQRAKLSPGVLCGRVGRKSGYVPGLVTLILFARKGVAMSLVLFARLFYFVSS